jgi:hypothetical protein
MAILSAIATIGVMLLRTHEWRWVVVLRYTLVIYSLMGAICVAIDWLYFPDRLALDVGALIFPTVYTIYFFVSSRVRSVFLDPAWSHNCESASKSQAALSRYSG